MPKRLRLACNCRRSGFIRNRLFVENIALYRKLGYAIDREEPFRGGVMVHMGKRLPGV